MVQLGMQLGANQMIDYSKKFGFGQPTGIELPGEGKRHFVQAGRYVRA